MPAHHRKCTWASAGPHLHEPFQNLHASIDGCLQSMPARLVYECTYIVIKAPSKLLLEVGAHWHYGSMILT